MSLPIRNAPFDFRGGAKWIFRILKLNALMCIQYRGKNLNLFNK